MNKLACCLSISEMYVWDENEWMRMSSNCQQLEIVETFCLGVNKSFRPLRVCFLLWFPVSMNSKFLDEGSFLAVTALIFPTHFLQTPSCKTGWMYNAKLFFFPCPCYKHLTLLQCTWLWLGQYNHKICGILAFSSFPVFSTTTAAVVQLPSFQSLSASNKCAA